MSDPWRCTRGSRSVIATCDCNSMCRRMKHFHIYTFECHLFAHSWIFKHKTITYSHMCALWLICTFPTFFHKRWHLPSSPIHFALCNMVSGKLDFSKACNTVTDTAHSGNAHNCRFHGLYFWLLEFALPSSCSHCSIQGNTTHAVLH